MASTPVNRTDLLLTYLLTPDEHILFEKITGKYPKSMDDHETEIWKMLRDLSQMRRALQLKEHELIELVNPRVPRTTQTSNLSSALHG